MTKDLTKYVATKDAAEMLGVNRFWIVRLLAADKIKGKKLGRDWIVYVPSLEKYLANKSKRGHPSSGTPTIQVDDNGQE